MNLFIKDWTLHSTKQIKLYFEGLSCSQKLEVSRFKRKEDQIRAILSGYLLNEFMYRHNLKENQLVVSKEGKKTIKSMKLYFNISHSGKYIVFAEHTNEIGIDIERISAYDEKIAKYCYSLYENKQLNQLASDKKAELFIWIWTRKEAYVKKIGTGLVSEKYLQGIETLVREDKVLDRQHGQESTCISQQIDGYILSICY